MKVIGKVKEGKFLCEINTREMADFMGTYRQDWHYKMNVGDEIDLSAGRKIKEEIKSITNSLRSLVTGNIDTIQAVTKALLIEGEFRIKDECNE